MHSAVQINVAEGDTLTISGDVTGIASLDKTGGGTLQFSDSLDTANWSPETYKRFGEKLELLRIKKDDTHLDW